MRHQTTGIFIVLSIISLWTAGCRSGSNESAKATTLVEPVRSGTGRTPNWPTRKGGDVNWMAMAFPTGDPRTSIIGVEKGMPEQLHHNESFTYEMVVTNLTNTAVRNLVISDECGTSFQVRQSDPKAAPGPGGILRWNLGELAAGSAKTIRVTGVPTQPGDVKSCTSVSYDSLMCAEIPVIKPQLELALTGPEDAVMCDNLRYRFTVSNPGTGAVDNIRISADLPSGLTTTEGKKKIDLDVGTLETGQTEALFVELAAAEPGSYQYRALAKGSGGLTAQSKECRTVIKKPVLTIEHTCSDQQFMGRNATMDILVTNTGNAPARNTVVTHKLPGNAKFIQASDGGRASRNEVRWELGLLAPKDSRKLSVMLNAKTTGDVKSTASVESDCVEKISATCQIAYKGIPAILLEVVDTEDPIEIGKTGKYIITATNQGSAPDTNIRVICKLEDNAVDYVSSSGATRGKLSGSQLIFEPLPKLAAKKKATWTVILKARRPGDTRFQVEMQSDQLTRPVLEMEATHLY